MTPFKVLVLGGSGVFGSRLCRLLASQGTDVVCATISLFHEVQSWNRDNIPGYCEIYLQVPMPEQGASTRT